MEKIVKDDAHFGEAVSNGGVPESIKVNLVHFTIEHNQKITPKLTQREFQIFQSLKENQEWTSTRAALIQKVWQNTYVCPKTFDVHLVSLRRKLSSVGVEILFEGPDIYKIVLSNYGFKSQR